MDDELLPLPFDASSQLGEAVGGGGSSDKGKAIAVAVAIIVILGIVLYFGSKGKNNKPKAAIVPMVAAPQAPPPPPPVPAAGVATPSSQIPISVRATDRATKPLPPTSVAAYTGRQARWADYTPGTTYEMTYRQPLNDIKASVIELTTLEALKNALTKKGKSVLAITMQGCGHCTQMKPEYTKAAGNTATPFFTIDQSNAGQEFLEKLQIRGFPAIIKFVDGLPTARFPDNQARTSENLVAFAASP